jgi:mRNA-degrading endonuclease RelE of RelBE toxin-antitoxin system
MNNFNIIVIALPTFTQNIRRLKKKYRNILRDVKPTIEQLESGETPGDQVSGIGYPVFKVRVRNTDAQRGKSGGYRILYYLKTNTNILLLTLYSKSEQDDIAAEDLKSIIEEYDRQSPENSEPTIE